MGDTTSSSSATATVVPPLVPSNVPLPRTITMQSQQQQHQQRPSQHVLGQVGYYCTDTCTPIFGALRAEVESDAALVRAAVAHHALAQQQQQQQPYYSVVSYILPTHPGHHAATDSFGGYCYLNHAAAIAKALSLSSNDGAKYYHCGKVSLHCDPDHEYPFHSGFADQTGSGPGAPRLDSLAGPWIPLLVHEFPCWTKNFLSGQRIPC